MEQLTFAALIRVSTERQAKRGESLRTQRTQIENAITSMNGLIYRWYSGQEHATPDQERLILDQLIDEVFVQKFNAVIVADISRWSRDNAKSKHYLEILKKNNIRFFVLSHEYDLFDPQNAFILGMGVEIAELFAKEQSYKSIRNRIERAKRGLPSCGKLPYGRCFNKQTGQWVLVDGAKEKIQKIADDYLNNNESFEKLGRKYGMNGPNLHKILTKRCGDRWEQRFQIRSLNIDETVLTTVPRLLPEETISQIKQKCNAMRTYEHGHYKYQYLFSRIIFDKNSGYALTGTPNATGKRYYRTYKGVNQSYMINADELEKVVSDSIFEILGCDNLLNKAISEAADNDNDDGIKDKLLGLKSESKKIVTEITRIADLITTFEQSSYPSFNEKFHQKMKELEVRKENLQFQIDSIENHIRALPSERDISESKRRWSDLIQRVQESALRSGLLFSDLPFLEREKIITMLFGGKDDKGKRYGIYVSKKRQGVYRYEAYGKLGTIYGLPSRRGFGDRTTAVSK